jgi:negative regulator of flagellin synthesis FlgM
MSNKIQGYGQPTLPAGKETRTNPVEGVARADGKPVEPVAPARDSVSVSDSALLMQRLEEAVSKASPTDVERIQQIKQSLANGEYTIDPQRIADKILKLERDLAGRS